MNGEAGTIPRRRIGVHDTSWVGRLAPSVPRRISGPYFPMRGTRDDDSGDGGLTSFLGLDTTVFGGDAPAPTPDPSAAPATTIEQDLGMAAPAAAATPTASAPSSFSSISPSSSSSSSSPSSSSSWSADHMVNGVWVNSAGVAYNGSVPVASSGGSSASSPSSLPAVFGALGSLFAAKPVVAQVAPATTLGSLFTPTTILLGLLGVGAFMVFDRRAPRSAPAPRPTPAAVIAPVPVIGGHP